MSQENVEIVRRLLDVAVARYTIGDNAMTDETPAALRPALPDA
jgi:hypothetical protein